MDTSQGLGFRKSIYSESGKRTSLKALTIPNLKDKI